MSIKHLHFKLNEEQLDKRHELYLSLLEEPEIQAFQKEYQCPATIIEENAYRFKRWLEAVQALKNVSKTDIKADLQNGEFVDLVYDAKLGILDEVIAQNKIVQELLADKQYLKNYLIFALPQSFQEAHFENLSQNIKQESSSYKKAVTTLMRFYESDNLGYYLYGDLGVGKSYLAACVSNRVAQQKRKVAYVHVPTLFNTLKQSFDDPERIEMILKTLKQVPLLVLDDLGAETITSWSRDEILLTLLNERLENKRKTLITGNYPYTQLLNLYQVDAKGVQDNVRAQRLVDRIQALTEPLEIVGKNRRNIKKTA